LMLSFFIFLPVRGVALPLLMGLGRAKAPAFGLLAMGLVNLGPSLLLVDDYGLIGVALGTAVPNVIFGLLIAALACRSLDAAPAKLLGYAFGRPLLGLLPGLGFLYWIKLSIEPQSFGVLIPVGVAFVALFALMQVFFVFKHDPHMDLFAMLQARLGRSSS